MALVKGLMDGVNFEGLLIEVYQPTYADRSVKAIHVWHDQVVIEKCTICEGANCDSVHERPPRRLSDAGSLP